MHPGGGIAFIQLQKLFKCSSFVNIAVVQHRRIGDLFPDEGVQFTAGYEVGLQKIAAEKGIHDSGVGIHPHIAEAVEEEFPAFCFLGVHCRKNRQIRKLAQFLQRICVRTGLNPLTRA